MKREPCRIELFLFCFSSNVWRMVSPEANKNRFKEGTTSTLFVHYWGIPSKKELNFLVLFKVNVNNELIIFYWLDNKYGFFKALDVKIISYLKGLFAVFHLSKVTNKTQKKIQTSYFQSWLLIQILALSWFDLRRSFQLERASSFSSSSASLPSSLHIWSTIHN